MTTEYFIEKVRNANKDIKILNSEECKNTTSKLEVECLKCNRVWQTYAHNLLKGHGCKDCSTIEKNKQKALKTKECFLNYLETNTHYTMIGEYVNQTTKVRLRCEKDGNEWEVKPTSVMGKQQRGCPMCKGGVAYDESYYIDNINQKHNVFILTKIKGSDHKILLMCKTCGKVWESSPYVLINMGCGCPNCAIKKRSGELHYCWKGGVSNIAEHLRKTISTWKKDMLRLYNYKCVLTGKKEKVCVHHFYNFWKIVEDAHENLSIQVKSRVGDYTEKELAILEEYVLQKHTLDSGIVISEEIHKHFHQVYGKKDNTKEQFEEFIREFYIEDKSWNGVKSHSNFDVFQQVKIENLK